MRALTPLCPVQPCLGLDPSARGWVCIVDHQPPAGLTYACKSTNFPRPDKGAHPPRNQTPHPILDVIHLHVRNTASPLVNAKRIQRVGNTFS